MGTWGWIAFSVVSAVVIGLLVLILVQLLSTDERIRNLSLWLSDALISVKRDTKLITEEEERKESARWSQSMRESVDEMIRKDRMNKGR
jgi:hypothetical protein